MYWLTKLTSNKLFLGLAITTVFGLMLAPAFQPVLAEDAGDAEADADAPAQSLNEKFGLSGVQTGLEGSLGEADLPTMVGSLIRVALSLLGVVAIVIVLIGGFKWMTAGGNDDQVAEARKWIFSGIIGLAIILSAWAITQFVFTKLNDALDSAAPAAGEADVE